MTTTTITTSCSDGPLTPPTSEPDGGVGTRTCCTPATLTSGVVVMLDEDEPLPAPTSALEDTDDTPEVVETTPSASVAATVAEDVAGPDGGADDETAATVAVVDELDDPEVDVAAIVDGGEVVLVRIDPGGRSVVATVASVVSAITVDVVEPDDVVVLGVVAELVVAKLEVVTAAVVVEVTSVGVDAVAVTEEVVFCSVLDVTPESDVVDPPLSVLTSAVDGPSSTVVVDDS